MVSRSFNVGRKTQTSDRTEMLLWSRSATNCPESGAVLQYVWRASQSERERESARVKSDERERATGSPALAFVAPLHVWRVSARKGRMCEKCPGK